MKNILFIMESFRGGGAEKVLNDLLSRFDETKYNLTLLVIDGFGPQYHAIPAHIKTLVINKSENSFFSRIRDHYIPLRKWRWKIKARTILRKNKYDIIISFLEGPAAILHSYLTDKGDRNITWIHVNLNISHWTSYLFKNIDEERKIYTKMDSVVFVSNGAKLAFENKYGLYDNNHVIYNVIDRQNIINQSEKFDVTKSKFTICNIGRFTKQKRQDRIIEIAAELKKRNLDFEIWILGAGKLESDLKEYTKELDVEEYIKFIGFKPNPYPYIKNADIFLLTSDTEGYPTVICEALCLGKPIVSTNITGSDELLANDVGILTTSNIIEMSDRIEDLIKNKCLLSEYATKSKIKSLQFNPNEVIKQIESLF